MGKRSDPNPLDEHDPRVAVAWKDKYGQTVRPGDLVTYKGYGGVAVARVWRINLLAKSGQPFTHKMPTMTLQALDQKTLEPQEYFPFLPGSPFGVRSTVATLRLFTVRTPTEECFKVTIER